MTNEAAKKYIEVEIKRILHEVHTDDLKSTIEVQSRVHALEIAIEALERQIAKAPTNIIYDCGDLDCWNCPNCGVQQYAYETDEMCRREVRNRCSHCGQLIDVGVMFNV